MATNLIPHNNAPASVYLGDSLYAAFSPNTSSIVVWIMHNGVECHATHWTPDSIGQLLSYATKCYSPIIAENDDDQSEHS